MEDGDFGDEDNDDMFGTSFLPSEKEAWQVSAEEEDSIVFEDSRAVYHEEEDSESMSKIGKKCKALSKSSTSTSSDHD